MEIPACGNDLPKQLIRLVGERVPPRLVEGLLVVVADKDETVLLHLLKRVPDLLFGEVWEELGEGGGTATGPVAPVVVVGFVRRVLGDQGVDVLQKDCLADAVLAGDVHVEAVAQGDVLVHARSFLCSFLHSYLPTYQSKQGPDAGDLQHLHTGDPPHQGHVPMSRFASRARRATFCYTVERARISAPITHLKGARTAVRPTRTVPRVGLNRYHGFVWDASPSGAGSDSSVPSSADSSSSPCCSTPASASSRLASAGDRPSMTAADRGSPPMSSSAA